MEYNKETATEIVNRFRLSRATLSVWRNRGHIPDKYIQKQEQTDEQTKKAKAMWPPIARAFKTNKLSTKNIERLLGIEKNKLSNAVYGLTSLSYADTVKVKAELVRVRTEATKVLQSIHSRFTTLTLKEFANFFSDPSVVLFRVLERNMKLRNKIKWAVKTQNPEHITENVEEIKKYLIVFINDLKV